MLKAIINGVEKDIVRIPMIGDGPATVTGTNSVTFETDANAVLDYTIKGNLQQSGTPAPDAPIMPEFVGERTANLFDYQTMADGETNCYIDNTGNIITQGGWSITKYIHVNGKIFSLYRTATGNTPAIALYDSNKQFVVAKQYNGDSRLTISSETNISFVRFSYQTYEGSPEKLSAAMLVLGSSIPLNYIPYGYKLPITCAGQTTPIYLGQTQTTRRIRKLVLTGAESWLSSSGTFYTDQITDYLRTPETSSMCSHYPANPNADQAALAAYGVSFFKNAAFSYSRLYIRDDSFSTTDAFKQFLSDQYSAGTPVTVWYILATPETAIVNEPLCKIGGYADELHSEDAGVTIPTIKGTNTLAVGTTLPPSSTEVTYLGIKNTYKEGWEIRDQQDRLIWGKNNTLTGVSPISFRGYGVPLKSIKIVGNTQQNGTPTPDAAIMPDFVGERTGNLFPLSIAQTITNNGVTLETTGDGIYHIFGKADANASLMVNLLTSTTIPVSVGAGGNGTVSFFNSKSFPKRTVGFSFKLSNTTVDTWSFDEINRKNNSYSIMGGKRYDSFSIWVDSGTSVDFLLSPYITDNGEFPNNFEPYGYKLPITNAGQTVPIYLGQTQTVRRVKKLVLTGEENWIESDCTVGHRFNITIPDAMQSDTTVEVRSICSHLTLVGTGETYRTLSAYTITNRSELFMTLISDTRLADWKSWLASQYSAGTPVTVWYVLATSETAIVNEPLCKIGDYADELTTDPNITPQTGTNTLTVDTTLSPSLLSITGHIKETV